LGKHFYRNMHTMKPLFLCLLAWVLAHPGSVLGQQRDHPVPVPSPQLHLRTLRPDSAALARSNLDRMPILKPDLSKLAKMPNMRVDSLHHFPMPTLLDPRPGPSLFEKRYPSGKPGK
jgi:hypothetical protein